MTSSRPGRIPSSSMNVEFSPPTTVTPPLGVLITRPVSLWPRTKSLKNVYAFYFVCVIRRASIEGKDCLPLLGHLSGPYENRH